MKFNQKFPDKICTLVLLLVWKRKDFVLKLKPSLNTKISN